MNICFTGHRPNKLGGYDYNNSKNKKIRRKLYETLIDLIENYKGMQVHFITWGALGVDQFAFDVCEFIINQTNYNKVYINEIAIPFKDQPKAWFSKEDKDKYFGQIQKADKVTYVDTLEGYKRTNTPEGKYNAYKMQLRNEYMVNNADIVIAVWNGDKKGGTYNCVKYAEKLGKRIIQINPNDI